MQVNKTLANRVVNFNQTNVPYLLMVTLDMLCDTLSKNISYSAQLVSLCGGKISITNDTWEDKLLHVTKKLNLIIGFTP